MTWNLVLLCGVLFILDLTLGKSDDFPECRNLELFKYIQKTNPQLLNNYNTNTTALIDLNTISNKTLWKTVIHCFGNTTKSIKLLPITEAVLPWQWIQHYTDQLEMLDLTSIYFDCNNCQNSWLAAISQMDAHLYEQCDTCPDGTSVSYIEGLPKVIEYSSNNQDMCQTADQWEYFVDTCNTTTTPIVQYRKSDSIVGCKCTVQPCCILYSYQPMIRDYTDYTQPAIMNETDPNNENCVRRLSIDISTLSLGQSGHLACRLTNDSHTPGLFIELAVPRDQAPMISKTTLVHSKQDGGFNVTFITNDKVIENDQGFDNKTNGVHFYYVPFFDGNPTLQTDVIEFVERNNTGITQDSIPIDVKAPSSIATHIKGLLYEHEFGLLFGDMIHDCNIAGHYAIEVCNEHGCDHATAAVELPKDACGPKHLPNISEVAHIVKVHQMDNVELRRLFEDYGKMTRNMRNNVRQDFTEEADWNIMWIAIMAMISVLIMLCLCLCAVLRVTRIKHYGHQTIVSQLRALLPSNHDDRVTISAMELQRLQNLQARAMVLAGRPEDDPLYEQWWQAICEKNKIPILLNTDLHIIHEIGEGAFGNVYMARCNTHTNVYDLGIAPSGEFTVAVKQLKVVSVNKLAELEREAMTLVKLAHPAIVHFYGVSIIDERFSLVFEYMDEGNLCTFLRAHNPTVDYDAVDIPFGDILHIVEQISTALIYLSEQNLVHRDVAARNCLLRTGLIVKLSDFGMTRDLYSSHYYTMDSDALVPLRWLPPESILYRRFTCESDIWSFGVLLWECMSYGAVPWHSYSNSEVLALVENGSTPDKPDKCPQYLYDTLMQRCWAAKPADRLTPVEINQIIRKAQDDATGYANLALSTSTDQRLSTTSFQSWANTPDTQTTGFDMGTPA